MNLVKSLLPLLYVLLISIQSVTGQTIHNESSIDDALDTLEACVDKLPPRSRELIEARYQKSLNAKEIASSFGMNSPAVRQRLVTIRRQLRDCISMHLLGMTE